MKDDEIDDLFRRNADYLADEPARDFDKDAFWQQLQTELPKKAERRQVSASWWWAAASVLLAGMLGGIWWMQSAKPQGDTLVVQETATPTPTPWSVSPQTDSDADPSVGTQTRVAEGLWGHRPRTTDQSQFGEKFGKVVKPGKTIFAKNETPSNVPATLELAPTVVTIESPAIQFPTVENLPASSEVNVSAALEKPVYRVVHINEIRERKQQEAKAQSRMAFRIGLPSGSQIATPGNNKTLLNILIQH